jgi:hypothetical protein
MLTSQLETVKWSPFCRYRMQNLVKEIIDLQDSGELEFDYSIESEKGLCK